MILSVANQKGGVGKTTIAMNLSSGLVLFGFNVLVIDNDPQGNLTAYILKDHQNNLKAHTISLYDGKTIPPQKIKENFHLYGSNKELSRIPERGMDAVYGLREGLEPLKSNYDFIIIDCLPGLDNLLLASLTASDNVIIPIQPAPFPILGLVDLFDTIEKAKKRLNPDLKILGILFNLVDSHKIVMESDIIEALEHEYGELVFKTKISKRVKVSESTGIRESIYDWDKKGFSDKNFRALIKEFLDRVNMKGISNGS